MILFSPAKINLFLRVLHRREDGYHELASLFQAVNLGDTLEFSFASVDELTCSDPTLACDASNLVHKALALFRRMTGLNEPMKIHIEKKIPPQAGLGGGSSNAATTLFALNQLHQTNLSGDTLGHWAALLGSDITFFFSQGRAFCKGRGEIVEPLPACPTVESLWLVKPPMGLSTPHIFKCLNLQKCSRENPQDLLEKNREKIHMYNDLEECAFEVLPALKSLKENLLNQGFQAVAMTGSGTGLLALGKQRPQLSNEHRCYLLQFIQRQGDHWYHEG